MRQCTFLPERASPDCPLGSCARFPTAFRSLRFARCRKMRDNLVGDRLRGFRPNFAAATRTKSAGDARPEQFQIIVDLRHRADGGARALDRIRLLDRDRRRDAADLVDARFVHAVEKLPHVWTECFDVTALAFRVNRVEGEDDFPLPLGPVMTVNSPSGRSRSIPLRLFWRAPRISTQPRSVGAVRSFFRLSSNPPETIRDARNPVRK